MNDNDNTEQIGQTNMPRGYGYPGNRNSILNRNPDLDEVLDNYLAEEYPAYLNIYDETRCYGGPEEGGWYYSRGVMLETPIKVFSSDEVFKIGSQKFERYDGTTDGRLMLSVSRTRGENYPSERPYYE